MKVRVATVSDLDTCIRLVGELHAESAPADPPLSRGQAYKLWIEALRGQDGATCAFVAEAEGEPVGFLLGMLVPYRFAEGVYAQDLGFFVRLAMRSGPVGLGLVRAYVKWARERGVREARIEQPAGVAFSDAGDLLRSLGFGEIGSLRSMRLG